MTNKIVINIWFSAEGGEISKIIAYYKRIFERDFQEGQIIPLGETPTGNTEMCEVSIFGQKYVFICTANEHHPLNDAISLMINCKDQNEIDRYRDYFTSEGEESQCGWCIDKYGLRWQVLPENSGKLMSQPDSAEIRMKQTKLENNQYFCRK